MDVLRFDLVTTADTASTLCTVPVDKAYTITGFTVVETEGGSGEVTIDVSKTVSNELVTQIVGQFGISGPDTIYPISNINMAAGDSLRITCSLAGVYITASVVARDVE